MDLINWNEPSFTTHKNNIFDSVERIEKTRILIEKALDEYWSWFHYDGWSYISSKENKFKFPRSLYELDYLEILWRIKDLLDTNNENELRKILKTLLLKDCYLFTVIINQYDLQKAILDKNTLELLIEKIEELIIYESRTEEGFRIIESLKLESNEIEKIYERIIFKLISVELYEKDNLQQEINSIENIYECLKKLYKVSEWKKWKNLEEFHF